MGTGGSDVCGQGSLEAALTTSISDLGELDRGIQQHLAAALSLGLIPAREEEEEEEAVGFRAV